MNTKYLTQKELIQIQQTLKDINLYKKNDKLLKNQIIDYSSNLSENMKELLIEKENKKISYLDDEQQTNYIFKDNLLSIMTFKDYEYILNFKMFENIEKKKQFNLNFYSFKKFIEDNYEKIKIEDFFTIYKLFNKRKIYTYKDKDYLSEDFNRSGSNSSVRDESDIRNVNRYFDYPMFDSIQTEGNVNYINKDYFLDSNKKYNYEDFESVVSSSDAEKYYSDVKNLNMAFTDLNENMDNDELIYKLHNIGKSLINVVNRDSMVYSDIKDEFPDSKKYLTFSMVEEESTILEKNLKKSNYILDNMKGNNINYNTIVYQNYVNMLSYIDFNNNSAKEMNENVDSVIFILNNMKEKLLNSITLKRLLLDQYQKITSLKIQKENIENLNIMNVEMTKIMNVINKLLFIIQKFDIIISELQNPKINIDFVYFIKNKVLNIVNYIKNIIILSKDFLVSLDILNNIILKMNNLSNSDFKLKNDFMVDNKSLKINEKDKNGENLRDFFKSYFNNDEIKKSQNLEKSYEFKKSPNTKINLDDEFQIPENEENMMMEEKDDESVLSYNLSSLYDDYIKAQQIEPQRNIVFFENDELNKAYLIFRKYADENKLEQTAVVFDNIFSKNMNLSNNDNNFVKKQIEAYMTKYNLFVNNSATIETKILIILNFFKLMKQKK